MENMNNDNYDNKKNIDIKQVLKNAGARFVKYAKSGDFKFFLVIVFIALCLRSSVFGNYRVPTGSMKPTIVEGDFFFANKLAYRVKLPFTNITLFEWGTPQRGDIIAFKSPEDEGVDFTKRVIGLPGDLIMLKHKELYVNGKKIEARYIGDRNGHYEFEENLDGIRHSIIRTIHHNEKFDNIKEKRVPPGHLFVMGDNRGNSSDSRVWGFLPIGNVEGKLVIRWLSIDFDNFHFRFDRIGLL
ncbi:MAG: signal peptidase I [bacterium]|nr:signal peptidase I [bacterium]